MSSKSQKDLKDELGDKSISSIRDFEEGGNLDEEASENKQQEVPVTKQKKCCKKKIKPWELLKDEMPDFSDDPTGKKEYMWKLNTLKKCKPGRVVVSVVWGMVMAMLDMSIVSVALVTFTDYFDKSSSEIQWVSDGYSIFLAAFAIIAGKVGDKLGAVNVNHVSMVCFMIFSLLCTCARPNTFWLLILARLLQGVSASFLLSTTMSLTTTLVEPIDISRAMAWVGAITTVAVAIGPFIGGVLVTYLGWQWIFVINVPIGIVGMVITSVLLPPTPRLREKNFDILGGIMTVVFLALLVLGITQLIEVVWLGGILLAVAIALIVGFCFWEKRAKCPLMPADVLFNYRVICSLMGGLCSFATMALVSYQAPFLMQFGWGYTAMLSGLCTLPYAVVSGVIGVVFGNICRKYSAIFVRTISNFISIAGIIIIAFSGFGGIAVLIIGTMVVAAGLGAYVTGSNTYIMVITPINSKGTMGGCVQCFRETGFSLGVALSCMFQDAIYDMIWGEDVPSGKVMPEDFYSAYSWTFMFMALCFIALIILGATLTQVSGAHGYEYERNFKKIPKRYLEALKREVEICHAKGLNALGFPLVPPKLPGSSQAVSKAVSSAKEEKTLSK